MNVGQLGPGGPTLALPDPGDDIPMDVQGSYTTLLELRSANAGLQITPVGTDVPTLPLLEPGRKVLLSVRTWGRYPNYQWFVVVRDAVSRDLLLAVHTGNLELFDGAVFREASTLGFGFSVSEVCTRFDPTFGCTGQGGYLTQLAIDANTGEGAGGVRISSGETGTIAVGGRDFHVWVGRARRVKTEDTVGCIDFVPDHILHLAVW